MEAKKEEIISKIMKLMELGNEEKNSNPQEREVAMRKAAELMAKWSIDFADLRAGQPKDDVFVTMMVDGTDEVKIDYESSLAYSISKVFDCKIINTYRNGPWQIAFCGTKHDLDISIYFFKFLRRTMYSMAQKNVTRENVRPDYHGRVDVKQARRNYCYGIVTTISGRLEELYVKREEYIPTDSKALMVVKKEGLADYFHQAFPTAVSGRKTALKGDINAFHRGKEDGRRVSLNRPISYAGRGVAVQIG